MNKITPKSLTVPIYLLVAVGIIIAFAPASRAGLTGPYAADDNTLHLWHLQDTNGTIAGVATNGVYFFDAQSNNPVVVPLLISNTPGPVLVNPVTNTYPGLAGQPGPGSGSLFQQIGSDFGYTLSVQNTTNSGFSAPFDNVGGALYPDLSYAYTNNSCSFVNTNTGAFTWEALIQPNFNPLTFTLDKNPEILCTDGGNTTGAGANPYTVRAVQFRFDNATPSSGKAELEFNGNISVLPTTESHDVVALLPTTGPDAVQQGQWYHVAVAYTGTSPTNGDPPYVLTLYWTKFDPTRTNADVLASFNNFFTITNTGLGTVHTLAYPSNSIVGTGPFVIGNSDRGMAAGWIGNMAEVRISSCYRHPNEFMFNTSQVGLPPSVTGPTTNNLVGYGQTLNLNLLVSGSQPYSYQWYQSGVSLNGQTNSTLVMTNITYAANTSTFYAIVTNAYGSATSAVATVTVGATFDGLFNTGCGPNNQPLDLTAPGSVDPHWLLTAAPAGAAAIPNAIVWADAAPLQPAGVVPQNGASVWIGPHENTAGGAGTYTYQTTFQLDETAVTGTNGLSGTVAACSAAGGAIMQMYLNGVENDVTLSGNPSQNIYPFSITNGLQPGSNTLVCTVAQGASFGQGFNVDVLSDTGSALTGAPVITNQPTSMTNLYGSTVSFQAVALGAPPLTYYWLSNGVAITPPVWVFTAPPYLSFVATNFSQSELVGTNFFANVQIVFSNSVGVATSAVATLDIQIPPLTLASAGVPVWNPTSSETNVVLLFSGNIDPVSAAVAGNYTLNNGATVSSATVVPPNEVVLGTSVLTPATSYTVTAQNVNSTFGFAMSPSSVSVGVYPLNIALWLRASTNVTADANGNVSEWDDISGNANDLFTISQILPQLITNANSDIAIHFEATNNTQMATLPAASLGITNNMSVFSVVNFDTLVGSTNGEIVSKTGSTHPNIPAPYDNYVNANGNALTYRGNGTTSGQFTAAGGLATAGLQHIMAFSETGNTVSQFVDGQAAGTGVLNNTFNIASAADDSSQGVFIGARGDNVVRLSGSMSELIVIGSAVSSYDVAAMDNYLIQLHHIVIINSTPTNLLFSASNGNLTLSWPADHIGWTLQVQTNGLSVGLGANWVNVPGSTGINQIVIPINLTNGSVFYRLIYP